MITHGRTASDALMELILPDILESHRLNISDTEARRDLLEDFPELENCAFR